jgi:ABC-2 type transport system ATP-binding protein
MPLLEFNSITKRYKRKQILDGVSFSIDSGEIFGLIGRSGSGKSTLLKILIGMAAADKGQILFEQRNAFRKLNYLRRNTGFATQENMLFEELTVKENSFYFGKLYNVNRKQIRTNFNELISLLGLSGHENTSIKNLSGGMAKRANLLVSLIHNPKLLVLDEPTTGLDPGLRKILWDYIHRINSLGTTILVTSHLLEEIEENCNRIGILNRGKIIAVASPEEYREEYGKNKTFNEIFEEILS